MDWRRKNRIKKTVKHKVMNGQVVKRPDLYNEYVKYKCKRPYMFRSALILRHFTKSGYAYRKELSKRIEELKADRTIRPPKDYIGITRIKEEYLTLFAKFRIKWENERNIKND